MPRKRLCSAFTSADIPLKSMQKCLTTALFPASNFRLEEDEDGHKTYPELTDGATVTMGGIIGTYKKINTRSGSSMAFISVEDLYGSIECVAFPNVFDKIKGIVMADKVVRLSG